MLSLETAVNLLATNASPVDAFGDIDPIRDPSLFDAAGTLLPQPAEYWASKTLGQRVMFGHETGIYSFPTHEGVDFIKTAIAGREARTIEIAAGIGAWAKALGIRATDSYLQRRPDIAAKYKAMRQQPAPYGKHVEKLEAVKAVRKYRPQVVVASWATQKFRADRFCMRGNADGVDELRILPMIDDYIFVGNTGQHGDKMILEDIRAGVSTHYIKDVLAVNVFSRAQKGDDFIVHIARK
ncbi:hypothetical protein E3L83_19410 [Salmonella enterica]|nr:hypothetical protein [Salmonella enterica]